MWPRPAYAPTTNFALWKEIRSYKQWMLIGSELDGHGVQIFDMTKVRSWLLGRGEWAW